MRKMKNQNVNVVTSAERHVQEPQNERVKYVLGVGFINNQEHKKALARRHRQPGRADRILAIDVFDVATNDGDLFRRHVDLVVRVC